MVSSRKLKKNNNSKTIPFTSPLTSSAHVVTEEQQYDVDIEQQEEEQQQQMNSINTNTNTNNNKRRQTNNDSEHENDDNNNNNNKYDNQANRKRNQIKRARLEAEAEEEKRLTSLLFGGDITATTTATANDGVSAWNDEDEDEDDYDGNGNDDDNDDDAAMFQIDRSGVSTPNDESDENDENNSDSENEKDSESDNENENAITTTTDTTTTDTTNASAWVDEDDDTIAISLVNKSDRIKKLRKSVEEDVVDGKDYELRLRERFQTTSSAIARTDWANVDVDVVVDSSSSRTVSSNNQNLLTDGNDNSDDDDDEGEEISSAKLLSSTKSLLAYTSSSSSSKLQPHILNVVRCPDANQKNYNQSTVQAVQFHPGSDVDEPLLLTAGLDKTLRFFKIGDGGQMNQKIHGINFPNLPIYSASFLGDTGSVVVSGRRSFFYIYDAEAGKIDKIPRISGRKEKSLEKFTVSPDGKLIAFIGNDGYIILVETRSKMWVADFKMNGSARAVSFTPDGRYIVSSGSDGEVYRWDLRTKKCVDKYRNDDGTITSYLSASSKFLAVGAESGVVNMYKDGNSVLSNKFTKRDPVKSIMNLHTSVDYMKFNTDGQILAMSSRREKDSLKLLHVPTQTVFSNWPTTKTPLSFVWSIDFSPGSKFMAVGNDKGKCLLYKLSHYHDNV